MKENKSIHYDRVIAAVVKTQDYSSSFNFDISGETCLLLFKDPIVIIFKFLMPLKEGMLIPSELLQDLPGWNSPDGWPVHWVEFLDTGVLLMGNWYAAKFPENSPHRFGNTR